MANTDDFGFSLSGGGTDETGENNYILGYNGHVGLSVNGWNTFNYTYGVGYYTMDGTYGGLTGGSITGLPDVSASIIVPKDSTIVSYTVAFQRGNTLVTGITIGLVRVTINSAGTKTFTQIGTDNSISSIYSTTATFTDSHDINGDIDKGDGILISVRRDTPSSYSASSLTNFSLQMLLKER
jgi:hypothetical protein